MFDNDDDHLLTLQETAMMFTTLVLNPRPLLLQVHVQLHICVLTMLSNNTSFHHSNRLTLMDLTLKTRMVRPLIAFKFSIV